MPRFNSDKWVPRDDSSPGVCDLDESAVVLLRVEGGCPCGCGEIPYGKDATFRMGHDARLRGKLIRAHLMDVPIRYYDDGIGLTEPTPAIDVALDHDWGEQLEAAALRRDGKNRELLVRALKNPKLLRAGRWEFTGGQVVVLFKPDQKQMMDVMYVNRAGEIRKTRVPADKAEEITK